MHKKSGRIRTSKMCDIVLGESVVLEKAKVLLGYHTGNGVDPTDVCALRFFLPPVTNDCVDDAKSVEVKTGRVQVRTREILGSFGFFGFRCSGFWVFNPSAVDHPSRRIIVFFVRVVHIKKTCNQTTHSPGSQPLRF